MLTLAQYGSVVLIWGTSWLAIKFQLGTVSPLVAITYRFIGSSLLLMLFCRFTGRSLHFSVRDHFYLAAQGLFSFSIAFWCVYQAEVYLASGLVAVIVSGVIILNVFNAALWLGERIEARTLLAALLGIGGMVLIFWPEVKQLDLRDQSVIGLAYGLCAVIIFSFGNIIVERNSKNKFPLVQTTAFSMLYGALFMSLLALIFGASFSFDISPAFTVSLLYLIIPGSMVAYTLFFGLIAKLGASRASYASILVPCIALFLSALFEDYAWPSLSAVGLVLMLAGNCIILRERSSE